LHDMMIEEFCEGNDSKFQEYMKPIELIEKWWLHMEYVPIECNC
jgi:hypothetical protein